MMATPRAAAPSSSSTWSDDSTRVPSKSRRGSDRGYEPVAITRLLALHLGAVGQAHRVRGGVGHLAPLREHGDLAALEQRLETLGEPVDDLALAGLRARQVERRHAGVDAEVGRPLDGPQHLGRLEQLLGRDASPVQARPADATLLDQGDVEPRRRAVERGRVAGRPSTEDHDVELLGQDGHLLRSRPGAFAHRPLVTVRDPAILPGETPLRSFRSRTFTRPQPGAP